MRYLDEWAKDKPQILVIIAQQIAIGAESFFEFLISIKAGEQINDPATVPSTSENLKIDCSLVASASGR